MTKKKLIIGGAVAVVLLGGGGFLVSRTLSPGVQAASVEGEGIPVMVEKAGRETIVTKVSAKGEVDLQDTELIYTNTEAEVEEVLVKKGDDVKAGDPLIRYRQKSLDDLQDRLRTAQLDLRTQQLVLERARLTDPKDSDIESAKIGVTSAEQSIEDMKLNIQEKERQLKLLEDEIKRLEDDRDKTKILFEAGGASQDTLDKAEVTLEEKEAQYITDQNSLELLRSKLSSEESNLELAKIQYDETVNPDRRSENNSIASAQVSVERSRLEVEKIQKEINDFQYEILSPIDGSVIAVNVSKGEITSTEKSLMEVANMDQYVVRLEVRERDAPSIELGMTAEVSSSVFGTETYEGRVTKIGSMAEEKNTSNGTEKIVPVELTMEDGTPQLKPGYSMEATIITRIADDAVVVPILSTLSEKDGSTYIYIVKEDNTLEKRTIQLGSFSDLNVEAYGVEEGETLVSQPTMGTVEGMQIVPIDPAEDMGQ